MAKLRLAVLLSGSGTTLQNMVDQINAGALDASVELVIGSREGLKGIDRAKAAGLRHVVFPRNAAIPNAKAISATNSLDGQSELAVRIFQGDHAESARNEILGEFTFSGVRPCPAGEVRLEILFEVSVEGILSVHARDLDTGREMKTTVRVTQS